MNDTVNADLTYAAKVREAIKHVKAIVGAEETDALEMLQHAAKFIAILDRHHRKLVRQAQATVKASTANKAK